LKGDFVEFLFFIVVLLHGQGWVGKWKAASQEKKTEKRYIKSYSKYKNGR